MHRRLPLVLGVAAVCGFAFVFSRPTEVAAQNPQQVAALLRELQLTRDQLARTQQQLTQMQATKYAHYSVWRRKPGVPQAAVDRFIEDVYGILARVGSVRGAWVGPTSVPEAAGGEIAVLLIFDDREGHKMYQEDFSTRRFFDRHARRWDQVKALDVVAR